ncbi:MAG: efflux RND transporter periplasmic adaptor subunit, partial [Patescibacteria group bacterium]
QKIINQNNIFLAESKVSDATSILADATDDLALKRAGATDEQIDAQENRVIQAEANVAQQKAIIKQTEASVVSYKSQLAKADIYAPINGIVTKQETKIGEVVALNKIVVSIISESAFEIKVNIPEADIAKVKIGNSARVTLDAYGDDLLFKGKVIAIDPAETVIEGVSTYKTTLIFEDGNSKIKSGMTANVIILTGEKKGVTALPQRAVILKNGDRFVRIIKSGDIEDRIVHTGLKGSDGMLEILDGVNEGDEVVLFFK